MRIEVIERRAADQWTLGPLVEGLRGLGHDVEAAPDGSFTGDGAILLVGSPTWYPRTVKRLLGGSETRRPRLLVWQTEPLALPPGAPFRAQGLTARERAKVVLRDPRRSDTRSNLRALAELHRAGRLDALAVCTAGWRETLALAGIPAALVPLGCGPQHGELLDLERDVDVLFIGDTSLPYRRRVFRRLRRDGLDFVAAGSWTDPALWGDSRTRLLNRTKILLNVARAPGQLAAGRFLLGIANGALVVSDQVYEPEPFVPGAHFVEAPVGELAATCRRWLADAAGRDRITQEGHAFAKRELALENVLARLVALVDS